MVSALSEVLATGEARETFWKAHAMLTENSQLQNFQGLQGTLQQGQGTLDNSLSCQWDKMSDIHSLKKEMFTMAQDIGESVHSQLAPSREESGGRKLLTS